ncbi:MAG: molybdenum cofactor biosynthesis protein MoaE [Terriglobales bacterium]
MRESDLMHDYGGNWNEREEARAAARRDRSLWDAGALHWWRGRRGQPRFYGEVLMKVGVLFFGVLKDVAGRPGETVDLPEGARVRDVLFYCACKAPRLEALLPSLAISVNREYSGVDRALREGDEVGLLPPVSGGSAEGGSDEGRSKFRGEVRIVRERIDAEPVVGRLKRPADGAAVIFDGVVRDNTRGRRTLYLEYEAYEAMALQQMESLAAEARARFEVRGVSIVHRLGRLEIGETSVLIVVASAHRGAAFEACRWIIDTLKKTVPIWKKEYFEDGAVWADGEAFPEEIRRLGGTAGERPAS